MQNEVENDVNEDLNEDQQYLLVLIINEYI
jgi:hypothetical protein